MCLLFVLKASYRSCWKWLQTSSYILEEATSQWTGYGCQSYPASSSYLDSKSAARGTYWFRNRRLLFISNLKSSCAESAGLYPVLFLSSLHSFATSSHRFGKPGLAAVAEWNLLNFQKGDKSSFSSSKHCLLRYLHFLLANSELLALIINHFYGLGLCSCGCSSMKNFHSDFLDSELPRS